MVLSQPQKSPLNDRHASFARNKTKCKFIGWQVILNVMIISLMGAWRSGQALTSHLSNPRVRFHYSSSLMVEFVVSSRYAPRVLLILVSPLLATWIEYIRDILITSEKEDGHV